MPTEPKTNQTGTSNIFDYQGTLHRLGGDQGLFTDLIDFFMEDGDMLLGRIRDGLANGDNAAVVLAAHSLKGFCSNFGAQRAVNAAMALEESARAKQSRSASAIVGELESAVTQLKAALRKYQVARQEGPAS
ncbi:MAG: Hpt domain-containing protein [Planctomycetaceae bacterium]|nr:Hpt domain-containing protein [Planctomycetaceae bacterium]